MVDAILWVMFFIQILAAAFGPMQVGVKREPTTGGGAAVVTLLNIVFALALLLKLTGQA